MTNYVVYLHYIRKNMSCQEAKNKMKQELAVFANRLKALRKEKGLKQFDMGILLGCTSRNYQRLEYGEINVPATTLIILADYFDVSIDYLLGRSDER